jgi:integrase
MRKKLPPRVVGIYRDRSRFRVVICEEGKRRSLIVETQEEAQRKAEEIASLLRDPRPQLTVAEALTEWNRERAQRGTCKPLTLREQDARLRTFLSEVLSARIASIDPEQAQRIYLTAVSRPCPKSGKPPAAASQRLYLKLSRALFAWAAQAGHCTGNPFATIQPVGELSPCKPQLGVEEARRFLDAALRHHTETQDALALAAATALLLGLRTAEVLSRTVADLGPEASLLRVERSRSPGGARQWEVPLVLRPALLAQAAGRAAEDPLFGRNRSGGAWGRQALHSLVRRLCRRAGVPSVCIDSLRALFAQLGPRSGTVPHAVAARLGVGTWPQPEWSVASPTPSERSEAGGSSPPAVAGGQLQPPSAGVGAGLRQSLSSLSAEQIVAALDAATLHRLQSLLSLSVAAPLTAPSPNGEPQPALPPTRASGR